MRALFVSTPAAASLAVITKLEIWECGGGVQAALPGHRATRRKENTVQRESMQRPLQVGVMPQMNYPPDARRGSVEWERVDCLQAGARFPCSVYWRGLQGEGVPGGSQGSREGQTYCRELQSENAWRR